MGSVYSLRMYMQSDYSDYSFNIFSRLRTNTAAPLEDYKFFYYSKVPID